MPRLKRSSRTISRLKTTRCGGKIMDEFCAQCKTTDELQDVTPNNDDNVERLSRHLEKLNIRDPKKDGKNSNYIKF